MASITFLKAEIGDSVSIRVPKGKEATYAALEAVLPKEAAAEESTQESAGADATGKSE
jgi:hypothetical protein